MDLGDCHNTFFDEYDTYISEEKIALNQSTFSLEDQNTNILNSILHAHNSLNVAQAALFKHEYFLYADYNAPKLFIRNSVWRI